MDALIERSRWLCERSAALRAHWSGFDRFRLVAGGVQDLERAPEFIAWRGGDPARQVTERRLRTSDALADQLLCPAPRAEFGDELAPVHFGPVENRLPDILPNGLPIRKPCTVSAMANRDRTPFGARMHQARKLAGMTQKEAAAAAGVSQSTLSELETDAHSSGYTPIFAGIYGVDAMALATGEPTPPAHGSSASVAQVVALAARLDDVGRAALLHYARGLTDRVAARAPTPPDGGQVSSTPTPPAGALPRSAAAAVTALPVSAGKSRRASREVRNPYPSGEASSTRKKSGRKAGKPVRGR